MLGGLVVITMIFYNSSNSLKYKKSQIFSTTFDFKIKHISTLYFSNFDFFLFFLFLFLSS